MALTCQVVKRNSLTKNCVWLHFVCSRSSSFYLILLKDTDINIHNLNKGSKILMYDLYRFYDKREQIEERQRVHMS